MEADQPKPEPPKRKRRWYQFSLRTLLVGVLIAAIPCALLGRKIEQKRHERETVAAIRKARGIVKYDYADKTPSGPAWVRGLFGENFFNEVEAVYTLGKLSDETFESLGEWTQLQDLGLEESGITDAGLAHLARLTQLRKLSLADTQVTDAGLEHLKGLTQLETLVLASTQVTGTGLKHLKGLTQLKTLDLQCSQLTTDGLAYLKELTQLKNLTMCRTPADDNYDNRAALKNALPNCRINEP
jgi:hypothetical protein